MMPAHTPQAPRIAVAIPCYRVTRHVLKVIAAVPDCVTRIYAVDDACPDGSSQWIRTHCKDPRVQVLAHAANQGVGGAIVTAYRRAMLDGMDIVVKVDGDGQMDPRLLPMFVQPILNGRADYTKGNRFYRPESVTGMPAVRLFGNAMLSFVTKLSCGYWSVMDPTNGYTAIHVRVLHELPLEKLERRYFFETDMLFRLNTVRAVIKDIPMDSVYADEQSHLRVSKVIPEFIAKHLSRLWRRYVYSYLVRDFNPGTIYSVVGMLMLLGGSVFGLARWIESAISGAPASSGTVMLAALPILIGIQFLVAFLHHDVASTPTEPLSTILGDEAFKTGPATSAGDPLPRGGAGSPIGDNAEALARHPAIHHCADSGGTARL